VAHNVWFTAGESTFPLWSESTEDEGNSAKLFANGVNWRICPLGLINLPLSFFFLLAIWWAKVLLWQWIPNAIVSRPILPFLLSWKEPISFIGVTSSSNVSSFNSTQPNYFPSSWVAWPNWRAGFGSSASIDPRKRGRRSKMRRRRRREESVVRTVLYSESFLWIRSPLPLTPAPPHSHWQRQSVFTMVR